MKHVINLTIIIGASSPQEAINRIMEILRKGVWVTGETIHVEEITHQSGGTHARE